MATRRKNKIIAFAMPVLALVGVGVVIFAAIRAKESTKPYGEAFMDQLKFLFSTKSGS